MSLEPLRGQRRGGSLRIAAASGRTILKGHAEGPLGQAADLVAGRPDRLRLRVRRPWASWQIVAFANWADEPVRDAVFDPAEWDQSGTFHLVDLWTGEHIGPRTRALRVELDVCG